MDKKTEIITNLLKAFNEAVENTANEARPKMISRMLVEIFDAGVAHQGELLHKYRTSFYEACNTIQKLYWYTKSKLSHRETLPEELATSIESLLKEAMNS